MTEDLWTSQTGVVAIAALVFGVVGFFTALILSISLSKAKKTYKRLTSGNNQANMEQLLIEIQERFETIRTEQEKQKEALKFIAGKIKTMKSKVGVHRYSAFDKEGNDLSFTIAMLDEEENGVLLTGIHSREQTYIYAKPVEKGQSAYHLSPEEKESLIRTLRTS